MTVVLNLTEPQIEVLREALNYGKLQVQAATGTPPELKKEKVEVIDSILRLVPRVVARIDD
jgi:hypothetical protein